MFEPAHVERVIRHLVRFGASRADAEDLAQEALVIAWRKQGELDRDRSLDAWLYGITRNVYRNHTRTLRRRLEEPAMPDERDAVADARELSDSLALRDALQALPENQQDIVILHELEQYTLKETAELLAIPFDTAKDRLRRARDVLRARMDVDLAAAATSERRTTGRLAKAAAPLVLAGVLAALPRSAAAAPAAGVGKLLLAGVLAGGIAIGVIADRLLSSPPERVVPAPIVDNVATVAPVVAPPIIDAAEPQQQPPETSNLRATAPATPAPPLPSADPEVQLVERARIALRRGTADDAIRTLMAHERRFPTGQLAEERDVLLVEAYLAAGNTRLARERLAHYRATYPTGLHRRRADAAERELEQRP